jgi:hypothetical protein
MADLCIRPIIAYVSTRYEAKRIACRRCGLQKAAEPGQATESSGCGAHGGNGTAYSSACKRANSSEHDEQYSDFSGSAETCVDIVVMNDTDGLQKKAPDLIEDADRRLCPEGILMIVLPVRDTLQTAVISAASWLARRNQDHVPFLSRQQLSGLLKSRGFTILESIRVRGQAGQTQATVLVARKTGQSEPASTS